jgi:hypothetical protein
MWCDLYIAARRAALLQLLSALIVLTLCRCLVDRNR